MTNRVGKCGALYAAASVVALGMGLTARADNLLSNPSFEAPTEAAQPNSDIVGWTLDFDCQREQFDARTGVFGIWAKTFEPAGGGVEQDVGVIAGNTYNLSSYVYFEGAYNTTTAEIQLSLTFEDSGGNVIGSPAQLLIEPSSNPPTNTFIQESVPAAIAPAGATQAIVFLGWNGGGTVTGQQSVFFDDADLEGVGTVIKTSAWSHDGSGDFNNSGNWGNGTVPAGIDAEADFFGAISANHTVFTDVPITLGTINFNNAKTYVLAGAGTLTLQVSSGNAQVIVQQGTQEINIPTTIVSNTTFNVSPGATLVVADPITLSSGVKITQTGGGTVNYESIITVQNAAAIAFGNGTHAHELNIATNGNASIGGTDSVVTVDSLANSGFVDVENNAIVIDYGAGADPTLTIRAQLAQGYNGGKWNGAGGIKSSVAAADASKLTALGFGKASDLGITSLDGQPVDGNSIVIKYTYYGDASLDGKIDLGNDFNLFLQGFLGKGSGWEFGDFNYDGRINTTDFQLFVDGFKLQGGSLGVLDGVIEGSPDLTLSQKAELISVVPEPASMGMLVIGVMVVAGRRRRIA